MVVPPGRILRPIPFVSAQKSPTFLGSGWPSLGRWRASTRSLSRVVIPWEFVYVIGVPVSIHGSDYAVKDSSYRDLIVAFSDVQRGPELKAFRGSGVVIPWATDRILEKPT